MLGGMGRWYAGFALVGIAVATGFAVADGGSTVKKTQLTIWSNNQSSTAYYDPYAYGRGGGYGGASYGGSASAAAQIVEEREANVTATGEVRFDNIATTVDASSVSLVDLTEPNATVGEQRYQKGAATPSEILLRAVGEQVTVVGVKGEITGILRAVDETMLAVEVTTGDQKRLTVIQRSQVQDVRLPSTASTTPTFTWRVGVKNAGKHSLRMSYRATGLVWSADYLAVLDESGTKMDFSAWATVRNDSGVKFENANVTLVDGGGSSPAANPYAPRARTATPVTTKFPIARPVTVGSGESVQVELAPAQKGMKAKSVVVYESMVDASASFTSYPSADCSHYASGGMGPGTAQLALEADFGGKTPLPAGRVRLRRRSGDQIEVVNDEDIAATTGVARVTISGMPDVSGERITQNCNVDENAHTIDEKLEIKVTNKSSKAVEVVLKEYAWRWAVFKVVSESQKGEQVTPQTREYRLSIPAKGSKSVTYALRYSW
jgi:hypothetical protein